MVSSTIGFFYGDSGVKKVYGHKFLKIDKGWRTYIEGIESYWDFSYLPNEIGSDLSFVDFSKRNIKVYALNDKSKPYVDKIKFILLYKQVVVEEVNELDCNSDVWVLNQSLSKLEVERKNGCIFLNGNLNKFIDGLSYKVFGVL